MKDSDMIHLDQDASKLAGSPGRRNGDASLCWDGQSGVCWASRPESETDGWELESEALRTEIAERRRAEASLRESERLFRDMMSRIKLISLMLDGQGRITYCNDYLLALTGWQREEVMGQSWFDLFIPPEMADVKGIFDNLLQDLPDAWHHENEILTKAGARRLIRWNNSALRSVSSEVIGAASVGEDITERWKAEGELRQSREQLRALTSRLETLREAERIRISREIHDELGQKLTGLKMDLLWMEKQLGALESLPAANAILDRVVGTTELVDGIVGTVQEIAAALRPSVLDKLGLGTALQYETRRFQDHAGIPCEVRVPARELALSAEVSTALFRVFQESLTNVARHARATKVEAELKAEPGFIVLSLRDNGKGITEADIANPQSLGLLGMKERVAQLGGEVVFQSHPGQGTLVAVRLPTAAAAPPTAETV